MPVLLVAARIRVPAARVAVPAVYVCAAAVQPKARVLLSEVPHVVILPIRVVPVLPAAAVR